MPCISAGWDIAFALCSGMLAKDTICAEMAMMLSERNAGHSTIDYPLGGAGSIAGALMEAILRLGGRVLLGAHVDEIIVDGEGAPHHRRGCLLIG